MNNQKTNTLSLSIDLKHRYENSAIFDFFPIFSIFLALFQHNGIILINQNKKIWCRDSAKKTKSQWCDPEVVAATSAPRPSPRELIGCDPEGVAAASGPRPSPREIIGGDPKRIAVASAPQPSPRKTTTKGLRPPLVIYILREGWITACFARLAITFYALMIYNLRRGHPNPASWPTTLRASSAVTAAAKLPAGA